MIHQRLAWIARRMRVHSAIDRALDGLAIGLIAGVAILGLSKFVPLGSALLVAGIAAASGLLAGAVIGGLRRVSLRQAAIAADRAAGTEEVITTAFECAHLPMFGATNLRCAEERLTSIPRNSFLPRHRLRIPKVALATAVVFAAMAWIPPLSRHVFGGNETAAIPPSILQALEKSGKDIKRVGDQSDNKELSALGREMQRLANAAQKGELTKKEALAKIASLSEQAEKAKAELKAAKEAVEALKKTPETKALADALSKGDNHDAKSQAAELARKMADGALSESERHGLKGALDKIAKESPGKLGEAAREAADALAKGDSGKFGKQMDKLSDNLKSAGSPKSPDAAGKEGAEGAAGDQELADAMDGLDDAEESLKSDGQESEAKKKDKHCDNCGKKKEGS